MPKPMSKQSPRFAWWMTNVDMWYEHTMKTQQPITIPCDSPKGAMALRLEFYSFLSGLRRVTIDEGVDDLSPVLAHAECFKCSSAGNICSFTNRLALPQYRGFDEIIKLQETPLSASPPVEDKYAADRKFEQVLVKGGTLDKVSDLYEKGTPLPGASNKELPAPAPNAPINPYTEDAD